MHLKEELFTLLLELIGEVPLPERKKRLAQGGLAYLLSDGAPEEVVLRVIDFLVRNRQEHMVRFLRGLLTDPTLAAEPRQRLTALIDQIQPLSQAEWLRSFTGTVVIQRSHHAGSAHGLESTSGQPPPSGGVGGTPPKLPGLIAEAIRLDVATPTQVKAQQSFTIGVAIKQRHSPPLDLKDLPNVISEEGEVFRRDQEDLIKYRVEVSSLECEIPHPSYTFWLKAGTDSKVRYFVLSARRGGPVTIMVNAYQEAEAQKELIAASTYVRVEATLEALPGTDAELLRGALTAALGSTGHPDPKHLLALGGPVTVVVGDYITVGNISNSPGVAIGHGSRAAVNTDLSNTEGSTPQ